MIGGDEIINILAIIAGASFALGTAYFMARTCFNWKYGAYLFSFLGLSTLIWRFLEEAKRPTGQIFKTACKTYSDGIHECGGWLFTHQSAYQLAEKAQAWMTNTDLASGQGLIAGFVVVTISLMEYSKASLKGSIPALIQVAVTAMGSYLIFVNISEIQGIINRAFDMTISFGKYDPASSYQKLASSFAVFEQLEMKMTILDALSFRKTLVNNLATVSGFMLKLLYGFLSWANLVMFIFQTLSLVFIPSMTATALINLKIRGPNAALQPLVLISAAVVGRVFVIGQLACINSIDITPEFGTLASASWSMVLDFAVSYLIALISLIFTMFGMLVFVCKFIWEQIFNPKFQAVI